MSKGLPVIQNFDGLLLLLNEPEKVRGYLNEIKAYRDEIKVSLDIVTTVEQARRISQEAVNTRASADQYDTQVRTVLAKMREDCEREVGEARRTLHADMSVFAERIAYLKSEQAKFDEWRKVSEADIVGQRAGLSAKEQDLLSREAVLTSKDEELTIRWKKLQAALA